MDEKNMKYHDLNVRLSHFYNQPIIPFQKIFIFQKYLGFVELSLNARKYQHIPSKFDSKIIFDNLTVMSYYRESPSHSTYRRSPPRIERELIEE